MKVLRNYTTSSIQASREKDPDPISDRLGNFCVGSRSRGGSFVEATGPEKHEVEVFAHELAVYMDHNKLDKNFKDLVLVAPKHSMGYLIKI